MKESIRDTTNGLDYTLVNDCYLPNLTAATPAKQHPIGRWGRLHKNYLKEQHPIRYNQLVLSGELGSYLAKLDEQAEEQLALIVQQMQEAEGVTEALKAANQMEWVQRMNNIRNRAEEIIWQQLRIEYYAIPKPTFYHSLQAISYQKPLFTLFASNVKRANMYRSNVY